MSKKTKKAIVFSIDAIFALFLVTTAIVMSSMYYSYSQKTSQVEYFSKDMLDVLATTKIKDINNSYVTELINDTNITDTNLTLLEQIGIFWATGKTDLAEKLAKNISYNLVPDNYGFKIIIGNDTIYSKNTTTNSSLLVYKSMITGIQKARPIKGTSARVSLSGSTEQLRSDYIYFGGFVGQGNITVIERNLPYDANVFSIYLEADVGDSFSVYINNTFCSFLKSENNINNLSSEAWSIDNCSWMFNKGSNTEIRIVFNNTEISTNYIGGGYLRVMYSTNEVFKKNFSKSYYYFPGIGGLINLYDGFNVPGKLENMEIYLHYFANHSNTSNNSVYLVIGNKTVYWDNDSTTEITTTLDNVSLGSKLNYSRISNRTVPLRFGFENLSYITEYTGNGDVIIITDVSGSMDWNFTDDHSWGAPKRECNDSQINDESTQRLSVAKCLDKDFAQDILNITGNKVGLVSYESSTHTADNVEPTMNDTIINNTIGTSVPETGYTAGGGTCICCGINSARDLFHLSRTELISKNSYWNFTNKSLSSEPSLDANGHRWYEYDYAINSDWQEGQAILGTTNGYSYSPYVTTEIGNNLSSYGLYANLWDMQADLPMPVDFTSGVNSTANTFGPPLTSARDDGWDYANGTYGSTYNESISHEYINQRLRITIGHQWGHTLNGVESASYGIQFNITQEMYNVISSGGRAIFSFNYWTNDLDNDLEEGVWIKARITHNNITNWLGWDLESKDSTNEIWAETGTHYWGFDEVSNAQYSQDISSFITGTGYYYIDFGPKIEDTSYWREGIAADFDNIQLKITNQSDNYYFRRKFYINNINNVGKGIINVLSDDYAKVYVNGMMIDDDSVPHNAEYWNRKGITFEKRYFRTGENVVAVKLKNYDAAAKFDLMLAYVNDTRDKHVMLMTDGQANEECAEQNTGDARDDAIKAACDATINYGIHFYTVGFSNSADSYVLSNIANCGDGIYMLSNNVSQLHDFYKDVAHSIISASRQSQAVSIAGEFSKSVLYPDSYIKLEFEPYTKPIEYGEVPVYFESPDFDACSFNVDIPASIRVIDSRVTSYSGQHWTDLVNVSNSKGHFTAYNLSYFSTNYTILGDPFPIPIDGNFFIPGTNTIGIRTGDNPNNSTNCSKNNTLIYTGLINILNLTLPYSSVKEHAIGCNWTVELIDYRNISVLVPPSYSGSNNCTYTNYSHSIAGHNPDDSYDAAMYELLKNLDLDNDGRIFINFDEKDIVVNAKAVTEVPYLWGPTIAQVQVWK